MAASSQAWSDFLADLREATELLRADPLSEYSKRRAAAAGVPPQSAFVALTSALTKGCVMLTSGRLQGCIESQTEEFLERLDQSGVVVDEIPEVLRASLCMHYFGRPRRFNSGQTADVHSAYATLWVPGAVLNAGTLKTGSLPDEVWNPWPKKAQELMKRCDIDLFAEITNSEGPDYLSDLIQYVDELIAQRNQIAHGDEPAPWSAADVRLRIRWAVRLARACDSALEKKLLAITGNGW